MAFNVKLTLGIVAIAIFCLPSPVQCNTDKVVCYFGSWSHYRISNGQFRIEDINPNLCTHVIYSFLGINDDGSLRILDTWLDLSLNGYSRFVGLKQQNPNLKTMITVGGWNEGSMRFSSVAGNPALRANFVKNVVNFLKTHGFDGFDVDWEFPAMRGGSTSDKVNLGLLLKELRAAFDAANPNWVLSIAVLSTQAGIDSSYDVPTITKYLDFVNLMTYDLKGPWDGITSHHTGLYPHPNIDHSAYQQQLNVDACVSAWLRAGAPSEKLVMGLGVYGKTYTLATASTNARIGSTSIGEGTKGPYTQQDGMLGYNEICEAFNAGGWNEIWDENQQVPYAFKGNQWIAYDNVASISAKVEYAKSKSLGGLMVWSIDTDDFRGACGGPKNPLLTAINSGINKNEGGGEAVIPTIKPEVVVTTTTQQPTTATSEAGETGGGGNNEEGELCKSNGYVRDPVQCNIFYYCQRTSTATGIYQALKFTCAANLYFDPKTTACNYKNLVSC